MFSLHDAWQVANPRLSCLGVPWFFFFIEVAMLFGERVGRSRADALREPQSA